MKRLVLLSILLVACGDNFKGTATDASVDARPDSAMIDAPATDAMPTPAESIDAVRGATDGVLALPVVDVTVTYIKPLIAGSTPANDAASFTVQAGPTGPALLIAVDPATLTTLTPALAVGDVVSFTVTMKVTAGTWPRVTEIANITRSATGTAIAPLVQDVNAATDLLTGDYESELVTATLTLKDAWGGSGSAFSRSRVTTTGMPTMDNLLQLRLPTVFKDTMDLIPDCVVTVTGVPVNKFNQQFQFSPFVRSELTIVSCPATTVSAAAATAATTLTVTFNHNVDAATVLANGSQFTITETATPANTLAVTAASVTNNVVTLTTAAQTTGTGYTVAVANTGANAVKDRNGFAIGAPNFADFPGYTIPIPSVMMAAGTAATTVNVTFTRNIDMATITDPATQFTITETLTPANTLAVSAATVNGMVVTLTTAAQTPGTMYTVTVLNSVEDIDGTPVGAPLTANFLGFTPATAPTHLVINEVDYNQAGSPDTASFIEIYNPTNAAIPLANFAVQLVNGGTPGGPTGTEYGTRVLLNSGGATELAAGGYLLIRNSTVPANGALTIDVAGDFIQNGPDGIALIDISGAGSLVDALHYGGGAGLTTVTLTGVTGIVSLVEAPVLSNTSVDPNDDTSSLARFPNGGDTDHANTDWAVRAPTPGATN